MSASALAPPDAQPAGAAAPVELRRFVAPTMAQCISRMRSEMGTGAVILATRTIEMRRWMGLVRSRHVEITVGRGYRTIPRRRILTPCAFPTPAASSAGACLLSTPAAVGATYLDVSKEIADLRKVIGELATNIRDHQSGDIPPQFLDSYRVLRHQQVSEGLARQIIHSAVAAAGGELAGGPYARALVCREIERLLKTTGALSRAAPGRPHVVALVGPTGVGKTTTIAKLAANLMLREGRKVGLITIDTYRIAAIDQLRKYAQIISAPLCVVSEPGQMHQATAQMADCDFILIDTAGRSPRDAPKLEELRDFMAAAAPDEVHLVLSSVGSMQSIVLALESFAGVRADRIIFTKLDEAAQIGVILEVARLMDLPLSYFTHGQDVPNDIEVASATRLALMMTEPAVVTVQAGMAAREVVK